MAEKIRRVVTGHDDSGTAIIAMDGEAQNIRVRKANGLTSTLLWVEDETPSDNSGNIDKADCDIGVAPPDGGSVFRIVEFTPDNDSVSNEEMKKELGLDPEVLGLPHEYLGFLQLGFGVPPRLEQGLVGNSTIRVPLRLRFFKSALQISS